MAIYLNGHSSNGYKSNGRSSDGYKSNGRFSNGYKSNGRSICNGYIFSSMYMYGHSLS